MPYKKKQPIPGTAQFNKLIAELPEKRENIKSHIQFRHDLLESQKRANYKMSLIDYKVRTNCQDWMPKQIKNARIKKENKTIINWWW